jgi:hypothetical protein
MDDEEFTREAELARISIPQKHTRWSFIVLAVNTVAEMASAVTDGLQTATVLLSQHRMHKIEEDDFYETVGDGYSG